MPPCKGDRPCSGHASPECSNRLARGMPSSSCNTCFALGRCRGSQSKHRAIRLCARWAEQTGRGNEPWCFAGWEHAHCTPVNLGGCGTPCSKRGRSIAVRVWCAHLHGRRPAIGHLQPPAAGDCRQNLQRAHACPCGAAAHQLPQQLRQRRARGRDAACRSGPCMQVEGARLQSWRSAAPRGRQGGSAVGRAGHQKLHSRAAACIGTVLCDAVASPRQKSTHRPLGTASGSSPVQGACRILRQWVTRRVAGQRHTRKRPGDGARNAVHRVDSTHVWNT